MDIELINKRLDELRDAGVRVDTSESIDPGAARGTLLEFLGVSPHDDYIQFVAVYGSMMRGDAYVSGLFIDEVGTADGCVVYDTVRARQDAGLPTRYIALHVEEDDEVVYLGADGRVHLWDRGNSQLLFDSLQSYILDAVLGR